MADNNNEDEYQFADLDIDPGSMDADDNISKPADISDYPPGSERTDVKRNALIVIVLIIVAMLVYKFMGSFFSKKTTTVESSITTTPPIVPKPVIEQPIVQAPVPVVQPPTDDMVQINQKLGSIDMNDQNIRSDLSNVNNQLNTINDGINNLNTKVSNLTTTLTTLSDKLEQQANELSRLLAARQKPVRPHHVVRRVIRPSIVYYIQAVIPGRAWLISTNGSTLTVREGTNIAGYGIVKLIDPNQGRVVTSSGRVIRFSQQDS
ncbi:MAG: type IVB secretion system protein IcmG/DotF [Legionella sp.]|nr:type IVB secretion system protein IcmG/DotF [Legionella sp.]